MGGSVLGNLAKRRENLTRQRKALTGGAERGAPQAPTRANPQPPPPPVAPAAAPPAAGGRREKVEEFLRNAGSQMQGEVPPPKEGTIQDVSPRQTRATMLKDRVEQLGATDRSLATQFYRLAGRMGSPLDLSMFAARLELERQLNRPPTQGEFQNYMADPGSLGPLFSPAAERRPQAPAREQ